MSLDWPPCICVVFSLFFDEGRSDLALTIFHLLKPEVIFDVVSLFNFIFEFVCSLAKY